MFEQVPWGVDRTLDAPNLNNRRIGPRIRSPKTGVQKAKTWVAVHVVCPLLQWLDSTIHVE